MKKNYPPSPHIKIKNEEIKINCHRNNTVIIIIIIDQPTTSFIYLFIIHCNIKCFTHISIIT